MNVETSYNVDEWADTTEQGRRIFNAGFRMAGDELPDWQLLKAVPMETARRDGEIAYVWEGQDQHQMLRIAIGELPHWRLAQGRLHEELESSMRSNIPRGTGALASLGDVAYVGRDPEADTTAAISFARGNVFVSVRSAGNRIVDVSSAARWLDDAMSRPPSAADVRDERVQARPLPVTAREPGEEVVVIDSIAKTAAGGWLKVIAPGGELRRDEDSLVYVAGSAGQTHLEAFITRARPGRSPRRQPGGQHPG
jgi:hypothetical protein